ncbi:uncharacterized protein LOC130727031 [Lotus japonicus]|uniref:uncharacterized protein LOC130727031 n=1 Tax=Lotus japonicus TaxID=34305 RepID=UPI002582F56F|nr:uncharacterized protein LOC130727031 [Lotus japonicus]
MLDNKRFCGSSHGWIATVDDANQHVITLINPFKNVAPIVLPWLPIGMSLDRVVLSVDPLTKPNDYVVAAIHSCRCRLSLIRAGQEFWTYVQNTGVWYIDITFYRGLVYAVCGPIGWKYRIVSFKLPYSSMEKIIPNVFYQDSYLQGACLVKSLEGDLWMVTSFQVYKLELDAQNGKVLQMLKLESLGDNVLFISDFGDSTAASSFYFSNCLQKDLIYNATNDYDDGSLFDLRVYNVKEGRFIKHDPPINPSVKNESPTLWILPQFQWD